MILPKFGVQKWIYVIFDNEWCQTKIIESY